MAGTNRTKNSEVASGPIMVLVEPQLGENIGMAARAMLNCGLTELRLVAPRDGWPNDRAMTASSGALEVITEATVYETTEDAISDLNVVYAASARRRHALKEIITPRLAAAEMHAMPEDAKIGVLFGAEKSGLHNDDIALAGKIIEAPLNPAFASLNLSQAVLIVAWEWSQQGREVTGPELPMGHTFPAGKEELVAMFEALEDELDARGFLKPVEKRPNMVRNIRNLFQRMAMTDQEVRTMRGIISSLTQHPRKDGK